MGTIVLGMARSRTDGARATRLYASWDGLSNRDDHGAKWARSPHPPAPLRVERGEPTQQRDENEHRGTEATEGHGGEREAEGRPRRVMLTGMVNIAVFAVF